MQGSNRQEYPLDPGGQRKEIANQIEVLCRSAFASLSASNQNVFASVPASKYWQAALHLTSSCFDLTTLESNQTTDHIIHFKKAIAKSKHQQNAKEHRALTKSHVREKLSHSRSP